MTTAICLMRKENSSGHARKLAVLQQSQLVVQDLMKRELCVVNFINKSLRPVKNYYYKVVLDMLLELMQFENLFFAK